jgi:hypothetical protein
LPSSRTGAAQLVKALNTNDDHSNLINTPVVAHARRGIF